MESKHAAISSVQSMVTNSVNSMEAEHQECVAFDQKLGIIVKLFGRWEAQVVAKSG